MQYVHWLEFHVFNYFIIWPQDSNYTKLSTKVTDIGLSPTESWNFVDLRNVKSEDMTTLSWIKPNYFRSLRIKWKQTMKCSIGDWLLAKYLCQKIMTYCQNGLDFQSHFKFAISRVQCQIDWRQLTGIGQLGKATCDPEFPGSIKSGMLIGYKNVIANNSFTFNAITKFRHSAIINGSSCLQLANIVQLAVNSGVKMVHRLMCRFTLTQNEIFYLQLRGVSLNETRRSMWDGVRTLRSPLVSPSFGWWMESVKVASHYPFSGFPWRLVAC